MNEQLRQRPAKPRSSSSSLSAAADADAGASDSRQPPQPPPPDENLECDVSVCSSSCAASSVADDWQCRRMSSRMDAMGPHLDKGVCTG